MNFNDNRLICHVISFLTAASGTGLMVWSMGGAGQEFAWLLLILPFLFLHFWTYRLGLKVQRVWLLLPGIFGGLLVAHVLFWAPLLMGSYAVGLGPKHLDYALLAGLFTAGLVGWYILVDHLWQLVVIALLCLGALCLLVQRQKPVEDLS